MNKASSKARLPNFHSPFCEPKLHQERISKTSNLLYVLLFQTTY
uniref:Uncharacterized protein n=1 Tax=Rhizophora mucronata TaxID=61149 RepID=A0A2P2N9D9_RHIMU